MAIEKERAGEKTPDDLKWLLHVLLMEENAATTNSARTTEQRQQQQHNITSEKNRIDNNEMVNERKLLV